MTFSMRFELNRKKMKEATSGAKAFKRVAMIYIDFFFFKEKK